MCQGDSGGPLLINFGLPSKSSPIDKDSPIPGLAPFPNMIVGVTSYGIRGQAWLAEGASPLTTENVVSLLHDACQDTGNQPACGTGTIKIVLPDIFPAKWGKVIYDTDNPNGRWKYADLSSKLKEACEGRDQCSVPITETNLGPSSAGSGNNYAIYEWTCGTDTIYGGSVPEGQTATLFCQ